MVGPPPPLRVLVLVIMIVLGVVIDGFPLPAIILVLVIMVVAIDRFPPTGSSLALIELDAGRSVPVDNVGEGVGVVVPPVFERGGGSLVVAGGGGETAIVDEGFMVTGKLRGTPVPVTDVIGALEAGVFVEAVGGGLLGDGVGTPLLGGLKEELVAMDEVTITRLEMVEVEERSSGDDAEAEDVKLGIKWANGGKLHTEHSR